MFKTILWATDGSETAARALPYALGLAETDKAKLVVVHVREIFVGRGGGYPVLADETELRDTIQQPGRGAAAPTGSTRPSSSAPAPPATPHARSRRSPRRSEQT